MTIPQKPVIAVTGSAGKSTTKEMISSILRKKWIVYKSVGNLNYFTHTQKYAKAIKKGNYRAAVLEYGMGAAGQIRKHCQAVRPDISVVTNIGTAHLGSFGGDVKKLILAKSEIVRFMNPNGIVVYNGDDTNCRSMPHGRFRGKFLTVGMKNKVDYKAKSVNYENGGMRFTVNLHGKDESMFVPIYGLHQVYNALCAVAVADTLGFSSAQIRVGLREFKRMKSRLSIYRLTNQSRLIDDSFSANPDAVKAALDVLSRLGKRTQKKTVAVLGPMLALGSYTARGHRDVGRYVAAKGIDVLYTYGRFTNQMGQAAVSAGLRQTQHRHFSSRAALHRALNSQLGSGCIILVKGSHDAHMGQTVNYLLQQTRSQRSSKQSVQRKRV